MVNVSSNRAPRQFRDTAFTLLELVLVLAILTLVVAMVAPSLQGFAAGRSSKNLATNIVTLTRYARTQAIAEGRTYRLNVDANRRRVWLTADADGTFAPPGNDFGNPVDVPDGVQLGTDMAQYDDGQYVQFFPTGRTDPARFRVTDKYGEVIEVACQSATELFRVLRPEEMSK